MDARENIEAIQRYQQCSWDAASRLYRLSLEMAAERRAAAEPSNVASFIPKARK